MGTERTLLRKQQRRVGKEFRKNRENELVRTVVAAAVTSAVKAAVIAGEGPGDAGNDAEEDEADHSTSDTDLDEDGHEDGVRLHAPPLAQPAIGQQPATPPLVQPAVDQGSQAPPPAQPPGPPTAPPPAPPTAPWRKRPRSPLPWPRGQRPRAPPPGGQRPQALEAEQLTEELRNPTIGDPALEQAWQADLQERRRERYEPPVFDRAPGRAAAGHHRPRGQRARVRAQAPWPARQPPRVPPRAPWPIGLRPPAPASVQRLGRGATAERLIQERGPLPPSVVGRELGIDAATVIHLTDSSEGRLWISQGYVHART